MPELPEVAGLAAFLTERAVGRRVVALEVGAISALKTYDPPPTAVAGRMVTLVARHGKWLDLTLDAAPPSTSFPDAHSPTAAPPDASLPVVTPPDAASFAATPPATSSPVAAPPDAAASPPDASPTAAPPDASPPDAASPAPPRLHLLFHLAKAGWLRWSDTLSAKPLAPGRHPIALRLRLDDGSGFDLTEAGTRKRLAVHLVTDPADVPAVATLGVEPLSEDFTPAVLGDLLAARNQQVKGLLRDQSAVAGIGNAYSDEILHAARTSPFRLTSTYRDDDVAALHGAIRRVLAEAVAAAAGRPAAELKDAKRAGMRVHGRTDRPCPGADGVPCGDTVREVSFADRSLQYCPTCQTGGQILADRRMSRLLK